jgi:hypothetical protein
MKKFHVSNVDRRRTTLRIINKARKIGKKWIRRWVPGIFTNPFLVEKIGLSILSPVYIKNPLNRYPVFHHLSQFHITFMGNCGMG